MATITEALGIQEGWFEEMKQIAESAIEELDEVSGILDRVGKEIREEDLGYSEGELSVYEKKLLMAGYTIGSMSQANKVRELMMLKDLHSLLSQLRDRSDSEE
jgi:hypothetical protein